MFALSVLLALLSLGVGDKAPEFSVISLAGDTLSLSKYEGKIVILDFWATWCNPCRKEIPHFIEIQKELGDKGVQILGLAFDTKKRVKKFVSKHKINYPVAIATKKISKLYGGISAIPTTFIIDKEGKIFKKFVGYRRKEVFLEAIESLLNEKEN